MPPHQLRTKCLWVWAPGHLPPALERRAEGRAAGRPGRAPGTIPSCIICKYCEVKPCPHHSLRPLGVRALPDPTGQRSPLVPCLCPLLLFRLTVSLQTSALAKAGPYCQAYSPPKPSVGAREEEGLPRATAGKELALRRPQLRRDLHRGWVSGALQLGDDARESIGLLREPPHSH